MKFLRRHVAELLLCASGLAALISSLLAPAAYSQATSDVTLGFLYAREPNAPASTRLAAAEAAVRKSNEYFAVVGSPVRVRLAARETGRDPARAAAAVQELYAQGVRMIVGPETSEEVRAVERLPIANDIVVISYASTAPSLARRTGNIFRIAPDDTYQAEAIAALMWDDGIRVVLPVWRDDVYGNDLVAEVRRRFAALGGQMLQGTSYAPGTTDFRAITRSLGQAAAGAVETSGRNTMAIYAVGFSEVADLMRAADGVAPLRAVWWYGTDGTALDRSIIAEPLGAAFAWATGYTAALYGEDVYVQESLDLGEIIRQRTGMAPEPYAYTAYDAVMMAGLAAESAGRGAGAARLTAAVREVASSFYGVTGPMTLNASDDRIVGYYEFWSVQALGGELVWTPVGQYAFEPGAAGQLERSRPHRRPRLPVNPPAPPVPGR
jgi:branched-chain amino acid transport system substrate-binding protein